MKTTARHSASALERQGTSPANPDGLRARMVSPLVIVAAIWLLGSAHAQDPGSPTAEHLGLTPAYLQGEWCNTHIQRASNRSMENRLHRFAAGGSFAAQAGSKTEMKPGLVYRYRPGGKIGMDGLLYQVKAVQPDEFVLHISGNDFHFHRGACK